MIYLKSVSPLHQKQNFTDIEIIMVDIHSKDNYVYLVKELIIEDPKNILYDINNM